MRMKPVWVGVLIAAMFGLSAGVGMAAYRQVGFGPDPLVSSSTPGGDPDSIDYVVNLTDPVEMQDWFDGHVLNFTDFQDVLTFLTIDERGRFLVENNISFTLNISIIDIKYHSGLCQYVYILEGKYRYCDETLYDPLPDKWKFYETMSDFIFEPMLN